jgi:hypothetical protein
MLLATFLSALRAMALRWLTRTDGRIEASGSILNRT